MDKSRQWGKFRPVSSETRRSIIRLLKQDPEVVSMHMIARNTGVGYSTVRGINNSERIRPKPVK